MPRYKYYYRNRPPGIGCQPDGFAEREQWLPAQDCPAGGGHCFGWVEYPARLSLDRVYRYDLVADDLLERAVYLFWRHFDDEANWLRFVEEYFAAGSLAQLAGRGDHVAELVQTLQSAGYGFEDVEAMAKGSAADETLHHGHLGSTGV
jgi:hypothetical protein